MQLFRAIFQMSDLAPNHFMNMYILLHFQLNQIVLHMLLFIFSRCISCVSLKFSAQAPNCFMNMYKLLHFQLNQIVLRTYATFYIFEMYFFPAQAPNRFINTFIVLAKSNCQGYCNCNYLLQIFLWVSWSCNNETILKNIQWTRALGASLHTK